MRLRDDFTCTSGSCLVFCKRPLKTSSPLQNNVSLFSLLEFLSASVFARVDETLVAKAECEKVCFFSGEVLTLKS